MARNPSPDAVVAALLDRHGQTFAEELSIDVASDKPSPLFRLLVATQLLSANIDARLGLRAARALTSAGYRTAERMAAARDQERHDVLLEARYLRKDRTARMLGEVARMCLDRYGGDLRALREQASRSPDGERERLLEFKGIGEVGADILLREVQVAWKELRPYADDRVLAPARRLGLPASSAEDLAPLVRVVDFARLGAALIRVELEDDYDGVREAAGG